MNRVEFMLSYRTYSNRLRFLFLKYSASGKNKDYANIIRGRNEVGERKQNKSLLAVSHNEKAFGIFELLGMIWFGVLDNLFLNLRESLLTSRSPWRGPRFQRAIDLSFAANCVLIIKKQKEIKTVPCLPQAHVLWQTPSPSFEHIGAYFISCTKSLGDSITNYNSIMSGECLRSKKTNRRMFVLDNEHFWAPVFSPPQMPARPALF